MVDYTAIAKATGEAFTAAGCPTLGFWRPTVTASVTARTATTGDPVWSPVRGFILSASKGTVEAFDNRLEEDGIKNKELRYLQVVGCDLSVVPKPEDRFFFQNKQWRVLGCTPVDIVGGVPIVHGVGVVAL